MDELKAVAVEVSDVSGVVAGEEVSAVGWFAFVDAAGADRGGVGGIDGLVGVAHDADV